MKKKKIIFLTCIIITIFGMLSCVYGSSINFLATPDKSEMKPGDTVTVNLKVANIDVGENGINTVEAVLDYDQTVFETVVSSNFKGLNNWSITYNGEEGENKGKFVAVILQNGITEDQTIGSITLKVKENIADTDAKLTFKNIKTNDGTSEIPVTNQTVSIKVKTPEPVNENVVEEPKNTVEQNVAKPENTVKIENVVKVQNTAKAPSKLPKTGERTFIILGVIMLLIVVSIIAYKRYINMSKYF